MLVVYTVSLALQYFWLFGCVLPALTLSFLKDSLLYVIVPFVLWSTTFYGPSYGTVVIFFLSPGFLIHIQSSGL